MAGRGNTRIATIDSIRDDAAQRAIDLDRLRHQMRSLAAENDQLRREAEQSRAALRHLEGQFAGKAAELALVYGSRSWRLAQMLRALIRRRPSSRRMAALARPHPPEWVASDLPPGVALIASPHAADAVARCNAAVAAARADRIVLWDGVSSPHAGWLEALTESLSRFAGAGMVGALLLAADGRIAAAGASILPDGGLLPRGCGERPDHPDFASVAAVEAVPLGGVMLPVDVWRRFGGLDETIADLALALAELALRLRQGGFRVMCQPFARLTAMPATSPSEPWTEAFGRFRVRRRRAAAGNGLTSLGLVPAPAPRVLFVDNLVPTPDRDSGSGDIHCTMRIFVALGYDVTLLPVGDLRRADGYVDDLRRHGVRVVANGAVSSAAEFLAGARAPYDLIMLHRGSLAGGALFAQLRAHSPQARLVFNAVDLHFLRLEREALLTRSPAKLAEAFGAEQIEFAAMARADCTVLLSTTEQRLVTDLLPHARTCVIPIAREIPGRRAPFAPRAGALFVGSFRHHPNVDAILTFAHEAWPLVRRRLATTLTIIGADAPPDVLALADDASGILVRGHVADLEAELARCRLTVAPLRFGAGIKGKVVTSLAAGVPCVASPVAVEGMGLADGVQLRVAAAPEEFAAAIVELHEQEPLWTSLSEAGLGFATATFSVDAARRRICALLRDLGLPAGGQDGIAGG